MAANTISSSRISTSLDGVQAANQRETRVNRERQRSEQAGAAERAVQNRVEQNADTQRARAQANDDAAAQQRRQAQAADKHTQQDRRQTEKTVGRHIDTTA